MRSQSPGYRCVMCRVPWATTGHAEYSHPLIIRGTIRARGGERTWTSEPGSTVSGWRSMNRFSGAGARAWPHPDRTIMGLCPRRPPVLRSRAAGGGLLLQPRSRRRASGSPSRALHGVSTGRCLGQIRGSMPSHGARVLEVRIHLPPAKSDVRTTAPGRRSPCGFWNEITAMSKTKSSRLAGLAVRWRDHVVLNRTGSAAPIRR
jgi:hypothetical protein